jgi:hypothetical protein
LPRWRRFVFARFGHRRRAVGDERLARADGVLSRVPRQSGANGRSDASLTQSSDDVLTTLGTYGSPEMAVIA